MVDDCVDNSIDTLRHSFQGDDRVVLEYEGSAPSWVSTLSLTEYSESEITTELESEDWLDPFFNE
jgi:hypothetical protein